MQTQSRVEKLLEASDGVETYFLAYTRARARASKKNPVFVFEGIDDPKYYASRISYRFGHDWEALTVKGKSVVKLLKNTIKNNHSYSEDKVAYFIDRDFDEDSTSVDTYVTPCYSIENLYTKEESIKQLLVSSAGLSQNSEEHIGIVNWIVEKYQIYKKKYSQNKNIKRMNLLFLYIRKSLQDKRISLDSLFTISHTICKTYTFNVTAKQKFTDLLETLDTVDFKKFIRKNKTAKLILQAKTDFYRGKQELSFLKAFVISIKSNGKLLNQSLQEEKGYILTFKNSAIGDDLLADLSSVASTPRCLTDFIDNIQTRFNTLSISR